MENTHELVYAFSILIVVKGKREKEGKQPSIGKKNILAEREEKQSRLEMCVDVEYVQKKCTHIHTAAAAALFIYSLGLNFRMHARSFLPLRNIANKEKNGRCSTFDLGYVVVEITKKKRKDKEFTIT